MKKHIVVLTGAGISAESGIKTFRDYDGLWENYKIEEVATPEAWLENPFLVQEFYNFRRKEVLAAQPNAAHFSLASLEKEYQVSIITQNIDNLHERAGSTSVLHLHGNITFSQSSFDSELIYPIEGWELTMGETCELGSQLRPHVVWFGEAVPNMLKAVSVCKKADYFLVIGTSLAVYPAASLIYDVPQGVPKTLIDPQPMDVSLYSNCKQITDKASVGIQLFINSL